MPSPRSGNEIAATPEDLPPPVARALAAPPAATLDSVTTGSLAVATRSWGDAEARPTLLVHGVTSSSRTWWRVGPALAATGRRVIALDLPGHGRTGHWQGRHRFDQTAVDVVAFVRAAGLDRPDLAVVGHSWGAVTAAHLPRAGLRPERLILLDPPALPVSALRGMTVDPVERRYDDPDEAIRAIGTAYPTWSYGDVLAKAEALTQFDEAAVRAVLLDNGDWDGGLAGLDDPSAAGIPAWIVRGETAAGGLLPENRVPALAACVGASHVLTIRNGPHSPQRTHPEATVAALLRALA